jgi:hypothetical protein
MGYGHFAFSNYYPSAPTYPLRAAFTQKHPEVIAAPNAEHHSFTDTGLHCNALGSLYASGYGRDTPAAERAASPLLRRFDGLTIFQEPRPWEGVYRLDVRLAARGKSAEATLTLTGARECHFREAFADLGPVTERRLGPGNHSLYLRAEAAAVDARLEFDPAALEVSQFRLMQGTNRPWREVFRAALDGEVIDGQRRGGLLLPEGGGLTLNHPTGKLADYAAMLDFDPRVLGIEVWNQLTSGFGSSRGLYARGDGPLLHFYRLWDEILRSGRRCWGFFVKDHNTFGRGRNVLLLPPLEGLSIHDREAAALRAYRHGCFFGSVAALATNAAGEVVAPYDRSGFRFTRLLVRRDAEGRPEALEVAVGGQEAERRPTCRSASSPTPASPPSPTPARRNSRSPAMPPADCRPPLCVSRPLPIPPPICRGSRSAPNSCVGLRSMPSHACTTVSPRAARPLPAVIPPCARPCPSSI